MTSQLAWLGQALGRLPRMPIMPYRYQVLESELAGYRATGVPLVGIQQGEIVAPCPPGSPGSRFLIGWSVRALDLSLDQAIFLIYGGLIAVGLAFGLVGAWLLLRGWVSRAAAVVAFSTVAMLAFRTGDVYLANAAIVLALAPLALWFARRERVGWGYPVFLLAAGLAAAVANSVRVHSGTTVLLLILLLVAFRTPARWTLRAGLAAVLLAGAVAGGSVFRTLQARCDAFVRSAVPASSPRIEGAVWHSVYIGLGYVPNRYGISYQDEVAQARVRQISPGAEYLSREYNGVLKAEVLRLARTDPSFVARSLLAKAGRILLIVALCANGGLLLALIYRKPWPEDLAFAAAAAFSALPGMIAVPAPFYLLGTIALSAVFAVVSLDHALRNGLGRRLTLGWHRVARKSAPASRDSATHQTG